MEIVNAASVKQLLLKPIHLLYPTLAQPVPAEKASEL